MPSLRAHSRECPIRRMRRLSPQILVPQSGGIETDETHVVNRRSLECYTVIIALTIEPRLQLFRRLRRDNASVASAADELPL